jgi:hypothetical protein
VQTSLSTDGGSTWAHETLPDLSVRAHSVVFDPANPGRILLGGDLSYSSPFMRVSTDLGATWSAAEDGMSGVVNVIVPVPARPGMFFCGTSAGCFQSTDGGLTWNQKGSISAVQAIAIDTIDPDIMYAGTGNGVFFSADAGENWSQMGSDLPVNNVLSLALVGGQSGALLAGTNGASAFSIAPLYGISEASPVLQTSRQACIRVEPNPARRQVAVSLPSPDARVRACVLDRAGRVVSDLGRGTADCGSVSWSVDAAKLSPGVYLVRIVGARANQTAPLVVVR